MKGVLVFVLLVIGLASAATRPDLNAFLNRKASNMSELIQQARNDRAVMDRYCRHYQMSPTEVIAHLKTLHPGVIKKQELYTIYSVPTGGYIKRHVGMLKVGTKVYIGADGVPELIAQCGNPLRGPSPKVDLVVDVLPKDQNMQESAPEPVFVSEFVATCPEPSLVEIVPETPAEEIVTRSDSAIPIASSSTAALLFPVGLFVTTTGGDNTPGVPSPAAAIPFIVGLAAAARARRRARKS